MRSNLSVSASAFYSRSTNDQFPEGNGNPIFAADPHAGRRRPVRLQERPDEDCRNNPDSLIIQPNPFNAESENPLYELLVRQYDTRPRALPGQRHVRCSPVSWFDIDGNASYDRWSTVDQDCIWPGLQDGPRRRRPEQRPVPSPDNC